MSIRFQSPEEAQAWAVIFAAQVPSLANRGTVTNEEKRKAARAREVALAAETADVALGAWRERAYGTPEALEAGPESQAESKSGDEAAAEDEKKDEAPPAKSELAGKTVDLPDWPYA